MDSYSGLDLYDEALHRSCSPHDCNLESLCKELEALKVRQASDHDLLMRVDELLHGHTMQLNLLQHRWRGSQVKPSEPTIDRLQKLKSEGSTAVLPETGVKETSTSLPDAHVSQQDANINNESVIVSMETKNMAAIDCSNVSFNSVLIFAVLHAERSSKYRYLWLCVGCAVMLVQVIAMGSFVFSATAAACTVNADCPFEGQFCERHWSGGGSCMFCNELVWILKHGSATPTDICNSGGHAYVCDVCYDPVRFGNTWAPSSRLSEAKGMYEQFKWFDQACLLICGLIVALQCSDEADDLILCRLLAKQGHATGFVLRISFIMRQYVVSHFILCSLPLLAFWSGGSTVEIFLNGLAVVFTLEFPFQILKHFASPSEIHGTFKLISSVQTTASRVEAFMRVALWASCIIVFGPVYLVLQAKTVTTMQVMFILVACGFLPTARHGFWTFFLFPLAASNVLALSLLGVSYYWL